jgi:hypothetical protein
VIEGASSAASSDPTAGLVLLVAVAIAATLVLLRKSPFFLIGRIFGALFRPLVRGLRFFRLIPRSGRAARPGPGVRAYVGPSAWAAFARPFAWQTETDAALGSELDHVKAHLKTRRGMFFSWLQPEEGGVTLPREYTEDIARNDLEKAYGFLTHKIPVRSNPQNLYEDIDGAFIVNMFKNSDRECFYVLSEMRKTINSNVRILSVLFSSIVAIVLIFNIFYSEYINFYSLLHNQDSFLRIQFELFSKHYEYEFASATINKACFGIISCCVGIAAMWVFYQTEYSHFQRSNGRELNNFLTRYLAQLNSNFRSAEANARGAIVGEKELNAIKEKSVLWFVDLQWIAFRFFFIESFFRLIIYQVLRNSGYYLFFVPFSFLIAILAIGYYANFSQINILQLKSNIYQQNAFYPFFVILLIVYYNYLKNSVSFILESIREHEWTQFHDLNMHHTLQTLIETYTGEIAFWRQRLKPGSRED